MSHSLEREYSYDGCHINGGPDCEGVDEYGNNMYIYDSSELCYECFRQACWGRDWRRYPLKCLDEIDIESIPSSDFHDYGCRTCRNLPIYAGYFHFRYKGGYPFLKRQINYVKKYPNFEAYWPETSIKAANISDIAVTYFKNLTDNTALNKVKYNPELSDSFVIDSWYFKYSDLDSVCCFRFSDYYLVCSDLLQYSEQHFSKEEFFQIEDKVCTILDRLSDLFLDVYKESLLLHPTEEIQNEINFIYLIHCSESEIGGKAERSKVTPTNFNRCARQFSLDPFNTYDHGCCNSRIIHTDPSSIPEWLIGDYWLHEGIRLNNLYLHSEAISCLTAVINNNPSNIIAYEERLHAHFEMGNLELAIEDYHKIKELERNKKKKKLTLGRVFDDSYMDHYDSIQFLNSVSMLDTIEAGYGVNSDPKTMIDFTRGFCVGTVRGGSVAVVEFVPSTWSCCKGILHCLWCFACSPKEVSQDLIHASFELVKFIKENTTKECLEVIVPELKDLCLNWDTCSDYDKGCKTGYIIGKYGVDILAPGAVLKGIKKYQRLKRLNSVFTVECCVASKTKKAMILDASSNHSTARAIVSESVKAGKIVPRNANVIPHVMQKKHAWDKLIKISGNMEMDFAKVSSLLEESGILSEKNILRTRVFHNGKIIRSDYKIIINNWEVQAVFDTQAGSKLFFLKDAWVVNK